MKKITRVLFWVIFLILGINSSNLTFAQKSNQILTDADKEVASSSSLFGINLLKDLSKLDLDNNIFISPLSASTALGMTINGAVDSTYKQIINTLQINIDSLNVINQSFLNLNNILFSTDTNIIITEANSIWCNQDTNVHFNKIFLDINKKYFKSFVQNLNFEDHASVRIINDWVNETTKGKISQIINEIRPDESMYLINAIYFKAVWMYRFDSLLTKRKPFYLTDGSNVQCAMMNTQDSFKYFKGLNFSALEIPYGNGNFNMLVVLPDTNVDLTQLLNQFDESQIDKIHADLNNQNVILTLPKFEVKYSISLKETLKDLGVKDAFDIRNANFSKIGGGRKSKLFISDILQKTYIKVGEKNTEAAAVTVVKNSLGWISTVFIQPPKPIIFNADHPFIFFITEKNSGAMLFAGKIVNPVE